MAIFPGASSLPSHSMAFGLRQAFSWCCDTDADALLNPANLSQHVRRHSLSSPVSRAATILRMKHVAMTILAYAFVLTTFNVNSLLFFHRNAAANTTFGSRPITASLVGAHCCQLAVVIAPAPGLDS